MLKHRLLRTHTRSVKWLMSFRVSRDAPEAKSNTADWEKWFQTLVITALITYSALSFPPPVLSPFLRASLPLDPSLLGFSLWPDVCHFAIILMASSLPLAVWSNGNGIFLLSRSFHFFFICSLHLSFFSVSSLLVHILPTNSSISKKRVCVLYIYVYKTLYKATSKLQCGKLQPHTVLMQSTLPQWVHDLLDTYRRVKAIDETSTLWLLCLKYNLWCVNTAPTLQRWPGLGSHAVLW